MQVLVTSFRRLKYLKACLASLRQDSIQLFVVDGGSDTETLEYISQVADRALFLRDNPGADVLKTEGIKNFVTEPEFILSSDDLVFPKGYSQLIYQQYQHLNREGLRWSFCACNLPYIERKVRWGVVDGIELREEKILQVAGAIIDTELCRSVGYFPTQYGVSGQGDRAFSKRLRDRGIRMCYFRRPLIQHIGENKAQDYPEYTKDFDRDEAKWIKLANEDALA